MNLGIIIQARMGSCRLPGKVLKPIGGIPLLGHILLRLQQLVSPSTVVVATSDKLQDDQIDQFCSQNHTRCFRGDENDVLDRYYRCAKECDFDQIVRLTADNPFVDIEELDRLIGFHEANSNSFTHSFSSLPIGVGAEIFTFAALKQSWEQGIKPHHREHVDEYLLENPEIFPTMVLEAPVQKYSPSLRLTVDTEEDLRKANWLVNKGQSCTLVTQQLIELCSEYA